jgi:penicillin-binding protein 1A
MNELKEMGYTEQEIIQGGYKIITTLDYNAQMAAEEKIMQQMKVYGLNKKSQQAALFSYDNSTGKILAYVGGKDYSLSQFDRVTQAVRQPGSSFKVFVYTTAMEMGLSPNDIYEDRPITIGKWSPKNYGNKYRDRIPLYTALALSSNVVAVRLIMDVGVNQVINTARRMGITTPISNDPTIALGSSGVKLFEITNAYGTIANGGIKVKPYCIERIESSTGMIVYQAQVNYSKVLDLKTSSSMVEMMKKVVQNGTGRGSNIGRPSAGKTGTTDSYRDAWFIGFTPNIVTGVWVGNDDNTPNGKITGGSLPAKIWADYMKVAESTRPVTDFSFPEIQIDSYNQEIKYEDENPVESQNQESETGIPVLEQENTSEAQPPVPDTEQTEEYDQQQSYTVPVPKPPAPPVPVYDNNIENR